MEDIINELLGYFDQGEGDEKILQEFKDSAKFLTEDQEPTQCLVLGLISLLDARNHFLDHAKLIEARS